MNNKKIFWICSYPKSGNTWLRLILSGLFFTNNGKINNFKLLSKIPKFDLLENFKFIKSLSKEDYNLIFNKKEYDEESLLTYSKYWIEAQKRKNIQEGNFSFFKTHNARIKINNNYYTNSTTTLGFIYILRDPRDIVISYSNHMKKNIDDTIEFLLNGQIMGKEMNVKIMPEIILNWNDNYLSWKNFNDVPSLFLKYEDLLANAEKEINKIINFLYKNFNIETKNKKIKIKNIIESTNFNKIEKLENKIGFNENLKLEKFFRIGKKDQWKNKLSEKQLNSILNKFKKTMKKLQYL
tara:strand:- start:1513 stop:2397 length:885 start_codon:yes stop_codon:yes gene_type:complete